jgi:DNA-directed RNA polymerase specialized sigma24 family protein
MKTSEIALLMGCKQGQVSVWLNRGTVTVKKYAEKDDFDMVA